MKISTRLKLAQIICIILLAVMAAIFARTTQQMRQEIAKAAVSGEVLRGAAALRYLSLEYVLYHQTRTRAQWLQRHRSLQAVIAGDSDFAGEAELDLLNDIRERHQSLGSLFAELQGLQGEFARMPERRVILLELEARLSGLMINRAQSMMSDAEDLARLSRANMLTAQSNLVASGALLGGLVLVVVIGAMGLTLRSVTKPLLRLHQATEVVGAGSLDFVLDARADDEIGSLARSFDRMVDRLRQTTVSRDELIHANVALQTEVSERLAAERKVVAQLARMSLLHQITRSIGDRQDLPSIFQVVIRCLEDQLPIDFGAICMYDGAALEVASVGLRSRPLAQTMAMTDGAQIGIDQNGLSRCVRGQLVYEPDVRAVDFPFPQRLAKAGMRSMVLAPLLAESTVFGVLIVARSSGGDFSSTDCEFLRQLSEHVALAANQARLYGALQQAYDDLHQSQVQVTKQERLRALGQMASGIAHDINNAISPIGLYAESLLETEHGLSENGRSCLQVIERAIDDVASTVARMREFYRQREPQLTHSTVNVNLMIQHVVDLTRARWSDMPQQRGIVIEMRQELAGELPPILGVEGEIREALTNLIFNAVDAMPDGGAVTLRTRYAEQMDDGSGPYVQVEVADSGTGMDEATQRRCLEPFFTTKGERGTGLGLATVYGMTERHSARIAIVSELGKGTAVQMYFPVAPASDDSAPVMPSYAPEPGLRILIVDDDPTVLASLQNILSLDGHHVSKADGGQAGIDLFNEAEAGGRRYEVVITDLGMPYVDGRKVAETVKRVAPAVPVILLTGWGQRLIPDSGDAPVHVDHVLSKPPKIRELRLALAKCTGHLT
ncbi:ATP-binding protein [Rugamonas aquatica]|uniref:histidine kinase n=1 Tax=Rugamonas aquatica TaxID=2743357 RepID=A0A6A7NBS8_9BURK|nr:response regulator [Rugamonas aquatica]